MVRRRGLTPGQITALILEEAARFPQRAAIVVENNAFGKLYEVGLRRSKDLPIVGHTTDKKKHNLYEGVPGMSSLYEFGKVVQPDPAGRLPVGTLLACIVPHCDPNVSLFDFYHCVRGDRLVELWPIEARACAG